MPWPIGHLGIGLALFAPAWSLGRRTAARLVVVAGVLGAVLPDVDFLLSPVSGVAHRGLTHTLGFVVAVALGCGLAAALRRRRERGADANGWTWTDARTAAIAAGALLVGGASHLFADVLATAPDQPPMRPLRPLSDRAYAATAADPGDPLLNAGLLAAGLLAQAAWRRYVRGD